MNEPHNDMLKIFVERTVRPVFTMWPNKLKMREELYDHALEIFYDELEQGGSEQEAVQRTLARMGDPAELTVELQTTVSRIELCYKWLNDIALRRKGETRLHHAWRLAVTVAVGTLCVILLTLAFNASEIWHWTVRGQILFRFGMAYVAFIGVNVFFLSLLGTALVDQIEAGLSFRRAIFVYPGLGLAALLVTTATGLALTYATCGDWAASLAILPKWYRLAAAVVPMSAGMCWVHFREKRPGWFFWEKKADREWLELEIDE